MVCDNLAGGRLFLENPEQSRLAEIKNGFVDPGDIFFGPCEGLIEEGCIEVGEYGGQVGNGPGQFPGWSGVAQEDGHAGIRHYISWNKVLAQAVHKRNEEGLGRPEEVLMGEAATGDQAGEHVGCEVACHGPSFKAVVENPFDGIGNGVAGLPEVDLVGDNGNVRMSYSLQEQRLKTRFHGDFAGEFGTLDLFLAPWFPNKLVVALEWAWMVPVGRVGCQAGLDPLGEGTQPWTQFDNIAVISEMIPGKPLAPELFFGGSQAEGLLGVVLLLRGSGGDGLGAGQSGRGGFISGRFGYIHFDSSPGWWGWLSWERRFWMDCSRLRRECSISSEFRLWGEGGRESSCMVETIIPIKRLRMVKVARIINGTKKSHAMG